MGIRQVEVQRFTLVSKRPFEEVMAILDAALGRPDMDAFRHDVAAATTSADLERVVGEAAGTSGLMEFMRFDIGGILRMYQGQRAPRSLRLVVGNPLIMRQMVEQVPDAASYAPVTLLIDSRSDGVHVSYDRIASFLAPYGNPTALKVGQDLDAKIESLLAEACG
jgi:hypothetical protein